MSISSSSEPGAVASMAQSGSGVSVAGASGLTRRRVVRVCGRVARGRVIEGCFEVVHGRQSKRKSTNFDDT